MRARLLVALLAFAAAAVIGFAWPLLMSTSAERTQQLVLSRTADLDRFAALADQSLTAGDIAALAEELRRYAGLYDEAVLVVDARRNPVVGFGALDAAEPAVGALIDAALRNQPAGPVADVRPWSRSGVLLARPVGSEIRVSGAIVLRASVQAAARDVFRRWTVIGAGALLAAAAYTGLALLLSRWVLRPVRDLESGMRATTAGTARAHVPLAGPPELRALENQFNRMSDAVADAAARQRRMVADASHQLRNPMTALRLRMDTLGVRLELAGDPTYSSAVAEVERLESLLDGLLAQAAADSRAIEADTGHSGPLGPAVAARCAAWRPAAEHAGVTLVEPAAAPPEVVACPASELAQVLDVLLDNAIKYAGAGATVTLGVTRAGELVRLTVADTGPGLPAGELSLATERFWRSGAPGVRGSGLGLSIAETLVTARGGRLTLTATEPRGLTVHIELPAVPP